MSTNFDFYAELELPPTASAQEILASFRRLARIHHPDKNPDDQEGATTKFQRINQAYETLSSVANRRGYDARAATSSTSRPPPTHPHYRCSCGQFHDDDDDDDDYYEDEDDEADEYEYFFGGPFGDGFYYPTSFSNGYSFGSRGRYEEMERAFREAERREAERVAEAVEQRRKRDETQAARIKAREEAKRADEALKLQVNNIRRNDERRKQEERWNNAGAVTKDQRLAACLHSDFCVKVPMKKKFKCSSCSRKGGMTAFECPYCSIYLCQLCVTKFSEKRTKGWEPKPDSPAPAEDSQSYANHEKSGEQTDRDSSIPNGDHKDDADSINNEDKEEGVSGQKSEKNKKKKKKGKKTAANDPADEIELSSPNGPAEDQVTDDNHEIKTPESTLQPKIYVESGSSQNAEPVNYEREQDLDRAGNDGAINGHQGNPGFETRPTDDLANELPEEAASTCPQPQGVMPRPQPTYEDYDNESESISLTRAFIRHATLARGVTEPLLRQTMERFGVVTAVKIDRRKGIAHVDFQDPLALRMAMAASPVQVSPHKNGTVRVLEWRDRPGIASRPRAKTSDKACFKCGQTGHISRFCRY